MDAAPRKPIKSSKRALGRSATNEPPKRPLEDEERLTPPVEIFVRDFSSVHSIDHLMDVSSSALTEVTFDGSCSNSHGRLMGDCDDSVTSDVSSKVDKNYPMNSSSGGGDRFRLPPRRQSSRRKGSKRGVMRWSSMPRSDLEDGNKAIADHTHSPRLPKRKVSNRDILCDSDSDSEDPVCHKDLPRLPTRKRSSDSLFSNFRAKSEGGSREVANAA